MRKGTLRGLINQCVEQVGADNLPVAYEHAGDKVAGLLEAGKVKPGDFSFRELFEELVDPNRQFDRTTDPQMIAEAMSASAFPVITNRILHGTILPEYTAASHGVDRLVREDNATKTQSEDIGGMTDIDGLEMRPELMSYIETDFGEKYIRIFMADFGRIISLSREAIFDDRTGEIQRRARGIGRKAGTHRVKMVIQTIEMLPRTAFKEATTRAFVYKGTAITQAQFYSTDHSSVIDLQVNANTLTDALGTTGLTNALLLFDSMVDTNGDEMDVTPNMLLVPSALRVVAWQLTQSTMQYDTANRAQNYYGPSGSADVNLGVMTSRFLSSSTKYYLGDFPENLLWLWVWRPATASQGNNTTLAFQNQIVQRYRFNYNGGLGHVDYRNIVRGGN